MEKMTYPELIHHIAGFAQRLQRKVCEGTPIEELREWCIAEAHKDGNLPYMMQERRHLENKLLEARPSVSILDPRDHLKRLFSYYRGHGCLEFSLECNIEVGTVNFIQRFEGEDKQGPMMYRDLFHPRHLLCMMKPMKAGEQYSGVTWVRPKPIPCYTARRSY